MTFLMPKQEPGSLSTSARFLDLSTIGIGLRWSSGADLSTSLFQPSSRFAKPLPRKSENLSSIPRAHVQKTKTKTGMHVISVLAKKRQAVFGYSLVSQPHLQGKLQANEILSVSKRQS